MRFRPPALLLLLLPLSFAASTALAAKPSRPIPAAARDPKQSFTVIGHEPYESLLKAGKPQQAESIAVARLAALQSHSHIDSIEIGDALDDRVELGYLAGRARSARIIALARRAAALHLAYPGRDSLRYGRSLLALAEVLRRRREFPESFEVYRHALTIVERGVAPDHPDLATALLGFGAVVQQYGKRGESNPLPYYDRALQIREQAYGPDDVRVGLVLFSRGTYLEHAGDLKQAIRDMERALAIFSAGNGGDDPLAATSTYALAVMHTTAHEFAEAQTRFDQALAYLNRQARMDSVTLASVLASNAEMYLAANDPVNALPLILRCITIENAVLDSLDVKLAESNDLAARALIALGRADQAKPHLERVAAVSVHLARGDSSAMVGPLTHLADARLSKGDFAGAEAAATEALRAWTTSNGERAPMGIPLLLRLARIREARQDWAGARVMAERARDQSRELLGAAHPRLIAAEAQLARIQAGEGDVLGALHIALRVATLRRDHVRAALRGLSERQALGYVAAQGTGLDLVLELAARDRALGDADRSAVLDAVIRSRALVLDEMAARVRRARRSSAPETHAWLDSLARASERYATLLVRASGSADDSSGRAEFEAARSAIDRAERALAVRGGAEPASAAAENFGLGALDDALPPHTAMLSYVVYADLSDASRARRRYAAFVSGPGKAPVFVQLGEATPIEQAAQAWRSIAERDPGDRAARTDSRAAGERLRKLVWDPVERAVREVRELYLVPDGGLHLVDLGALPSGRNDYVLEHAPLMVRLSSERDAQRESAAEQRAGLLALGDVTYDATATDSGLVASAAAYRGAPSQCESFSAVRFAALPATRPEIDDVARRWRAHDGEDCRVLTAAAAGEEAFKQLAPGRRALHLATHGFFLGGRCAIATPDLRGIGGLAPVDSGGTHVEFASTPEASLPSPIIPEIMAVPENPLRLAGLALAGANRRGQTSALQDDGILTAEEIAALDLGSVECAVLSACDTGAGAVTSGEGVFGLQRAFRLAGARSLVMGLWAVRDEDAQDWMAAFYAARLTRGASVAAAARAASLARLKVERGRGHDASPARWAGFVSSGLAD